MDATHSHYRSKLKRYLIAGLLVWLPLIATIAVIRFLVTLLDGSLNMLPTRYQPQHLLGIQVPGISIVFSFLIVLITGFFTNNFIGKKCVTAGEKILQRIPLIRSIHSAVKKVLETLLQSKGQSFRKVLLVEYPRKGIYSFAFQTAELSQASGNLVTVFIPTTPNPTSGFLLLLPKEATQEIEMTVEEAMRMIISIGVAAPESMANIILPNQKES